eukprot:TRINITY_DN10737_c0_g2_i16.p1 TRINITY_DN10737_c0_g2~~TRINITY_DN10737_c0_g2_i16.p1  ORF type:complete len:222 (+),score=18.04 TRINITY_DN10737_c0_g2_i16:207-872(+)
MLNDYANMLWIPEDYKSAQVMLETIRKRRVGKEVAEALQYYVHDSSDCLVLSRPLINQRTSVKPLETTLESVPLKELYEGKLSQCLQNIYRIRVNVLEIRPKEMNKCIFFIDRATGARFSLKDKGKDNEEWYLKLRLLVKDSSNKSDNNLYTIYLCTIDGRGSEFIKFGSNKWEDAYLKQFKKVCKQLVRPWVVLDCMIEELKTNLGQSVFFLVNTSLTLD